MLARLSIIALTVLGLLAIGYVIFTTGITPRSYSVPAGRWRQRSCRER